MESLFSLKIKMKKKIVRKFRKVKMINLRTKMIMRKRNKLMNQTNNKLKIY